MALGLSEKKKTESICNTVRTFNYHISYEHQHKYEKINDVKAHKLCILVQCPCVATGSWNSLQELYKDNAC